MLITTWTQSFGLRVWNPSENASQLSNDDLVPKLHFLKWWLCVCRRWRGQSAVKTLKHSHIDNENTWRQFSSKRREKRWKKAFFKFKSIYFLFISNLCINKIIGQIFIYNTQLKVNSILRHENKSNCNLNFRILSSSLERGNYDNALVCAFLSTVPISGRVSPVMLTPVTDSDWFECTTRQHLPIECMC